MKTIGEIRRANLELLVREFRTLEQVAELASSSSVYLSQIKNQALDTETGTPRQMGTQMARRLEKAANKPSGWMDQDHDESTMPSFSRSYEFSLAEPSPAPYAMTNAQVLEQLRVLLARVPPGSRDSVGAVLASWAKSGGADTGHAAAVLALLGASK